MTEYRAIFDFRVLFTNGGELTGSGFRLDVPEEAVSSDEVGLLLVRRLGLVMAGKIEVRDLRIVAEAHREAAPPPAAAARRRVIDVSHAIAAGMVTYPGLPGPEIVEHLSRDAAERSYGPGVRFQIGRISMVANTGTYVDSPFHRFDGGVDLARLPLDRLAALDGVVVRLTGSQARAIGAAELAPYEVAGRAVLLHTGWDRHWGTAAYGVDAPFLTAEATRWLVAQGAGSSASIRSTSTTWAIARGRRTRACSRRACRSSSTCAGLASCRRRGSRFTPLPRRSSSSARSRSGPTR